MHLLVVLKKCLWSSVPYPQVVTVNQDHVVLASVSITEGIRNHCFRQFCSITKILSLYAEVLMNHMQN